MNIRLKDQYRPDFDRIMDGYETKREALVRNEMNSTDMLEDLFMRLNLNLSRMVKK